MRVIQATSGHIQPWLGLRRQLWPDPDEAHLPEMQEILGSESAAAFLLLNERNEAIGFIEGALYLGGPRPYGYIEGWFVVPAFRGRGLGGQLLGSLEGWILHHSISLVLSDTIPEEYPLSTRAHAHYGYEALKNLTIFIKKIGPQAGENSGPG
jgi:aminoglycoside 6'-N-acetyltransferase I